MQPSHGKLTIVHFSVENLLQQICYFLDSNDLGDT